MRKLPFCVLVFIFSSALSYAQHTVNDIKNYNGWYEVKFEILQSEKILYNITQCYPSGDRYEVIGNEREKLPLYLKVLVMGMVDEGMKDSFDFDEMTFDENGVFMRMTSFSFTFVFNISKTEEEILNEIGADMVNKYRLRKWS